MRVAFLLSIFIFIADARASIIAFEMQGKIFSWNTEQIAIDHKNYRYFLPRSLFQSKDLKEGKQVSLLVSQDQFMSCVKSRKSLKK